MTIDDLVAEVAVQTTKVDSFISFVAGLKQQLADALANAGGLTPEQQAAVDGVFATVQSNDQKITDAMAANT
jgi:hypothetical protein